MTTEALTAVGLAPTGLAGGRVNDWGGNAKLAGDRLFVVESDEYDQAFLALSPAIAVVNNVEADHLECYGSLEALEDAFVTFAGRAERAILGADDPGGRRVSGRLGRTAVWTFGLGEADFRITDIAQGPEGSRARVSVPGQAPVQLKLQVPGIHNVRNATAALAVVHALEGPLAPALEALSRYRGLGRRFERLGEVRGVALVDDYAHHPSELEATLAAARQAFPGRRLVAVFQPHLYSRTALHGLAMGRALAAADVVLVTEIYAAREQPMPGVSGQSVADAARQAGAAVLFEPDRERVAERLHALIRPGDVVVTLGAGDITRVGRELVQWLNAA
jgi:UDP-N-acetylmuramate--alanine ligase